MSQPVKPSDVHSTCSMRPALQKVSTLPSQVAAKFESEPSAAGTHSLARPQKNERSCSRQPKPGPWVVQSSVALFPPTQASSVSPVQPTPSNSTTSPSPRELPQSAPVPTQAPRSQLSPRAPHATPCQTTPSSQYSGRPSAVQPETN